MVATFTPALSQIRETAPDAVTLLRMLCFCDPEGIPISMFKQGCDALPPEHQFGSSKARPLKGFQRSFAQVCIALHRRTRHDTTNVQGNDKLDAAKDLFQSAVRHPNVMVHFHVPIIHGVDHAWWDGYFLTPTQVLELLWKVRAEISRRGQNSVDSKSKCSLVFSSRRDSRDTVRDVI